MNARVKLFHRSFSLVFAIWLVAGIVFLSALFLGCEDEECLVWGENCSQAYKESEYGTTSVQCCSGQCADHGGADVSCGS